MCFGNEFSFHVSAWNCDSYAIIYKFANTKCFLVLFLFFWHFIFASSYEMEGNYKYYSLGVTIIRMRVEQRAFFSLLWILLFYVRQECTAITKTGTNEREKTVKAKRNWRNRLKWSTKRQWNVMHKKRNIIVWMCVLCVQQPFHWVSLFFFPLSLTLQSVPVR